MAGPLRVEHEVEVARWVQEALREDFSVSAVVPPVFEACARILHPASLDVPTDEMDAWGNLQFASREITWAEAAELIGDRASRSQPYTAWLARFGEQQFEMPDGGWLNEPHQGDIPLPLLTALAQLLLDEHGEADVLAAVWEGSGLDMSSVSVFAAADDSMSGLLADWRARRDAEDAHIAELRASIDPDVVDAMRHGHVLGLPREHQGRGHVLLRGRLVSLTDPTWVEAAGLGWRPGGWEGDGRTPNLLWPAEPDASPAWMVATDLDLDTTLIGGSARLIGRVLAHPSFEAERVLPTDPLV
ncbi:hypothetical protein [Agrococcus jenensis]|uniref:Uncharacterized protein n=1 Tax=Agrococcus jenensis TaxID=46353 RepID=A0A3N2AR97_9MICO|nr:hypothetical protein [Agrococcus jenensis]ROR65425.1 hypothetical protein EDD26_0791 [Agrococcus jenensis]